MRAAWIPHGPQAAATLAYLQDFRLMMWITLAALPLVLLLRKPEAPAAGPAVLD